MNGVDRLVDVCIVVIPLAQVYGLWGLRKEKACYLSHSLVLKPFCEWDYNATEVTFFQYEASRRHISRMLSISITWMHGNLKALLQILLANINCCDIWLLQHWTGFNSLSSNRQDMYGVQKPKLNWDTNCPVWVQLLWWKWKWINKEFIVQL